MSTDYKRIQQRNGSYDDFVLSNLLPNEFGSVTSGDPNTDDGKALYFKFSTDIKRIMMAGETLPDDSVGTDTISDEAVTLDKLDESVYTDTPANGDERLLTAGGAYTALGNKISNSNGSVTTSNIADENVTYAKLSSELQSTIDSVPETPLGYTRLGDLITATALDSATYCNVSGFYQFTAVSSLAASIGVNSGTKCELRYVNGYQVVTATATQEKYVRKVNSVAPTFSASSWGKVIDNIETGTISSTAIVPSGSTKTISGTYELNGDYCTVSADVNTDSGASEMQFALPVTSLSPSYAIGQGAGTYLINTGASNSNVVIKPLSSGTLSEATVSFTITYKYK